MRGTEKPDYEKISALEIELGLVPREDAQSEFVNSFYNLSGRLPTNKELNAVSNLVGTTYQRFINDCTRNPRWWEDRDDLAN